MKLNGNNIIVDNDVTMTGQYIGETLDTVLNKQEQDISTLKSNVKWLYQNGGVGGKGGGGGTTKDWTIYAKLDNIEIINDSNNSIQLKGDGIYQLEVRINNPNNGDFLCKVTYNNSKGKQSPASTRLNADNSFKTSFNVNLDSNDTITVEVQNNITGESKQVSQQFITNAYNFSIKYTSDKGESYDEDDIFIKNIQNKGIKLQLHYEIGLQGATIKYKYTKFDGTETELTKLDYTVGSDDILLDLLNGNITNDMMGYYSTICTIEVTPEGQNPVTIQKTLSCNLIPNDIYLKISPEYSVLYDNEVEDPQTFTPGSIIFYVTAYQGDNKNRTYTVIPKLNGNPLDPVTIKERTQAKITIVATQSGKNTIQFEIGTLSYTTKLKLFYINNPLKDYDYSTLFTSKEPYKRVYHWGTDSAQYSEDTKDLFGNSALLKCTASDTPKELTWNYNEEFTPTSFICNISIAASSLIDTSKPLLILEDEYGINNDYIQNYIYIYQNKITIGLDGTSNNFYIPTNEILDGTASKQYHLLTIFKKLTYEKNNNYYFEYLFYIDGVLESSTIVNTTVKYCKIIFNNQEFVCNLVDFIQYKRKDFSVLPTDRDICRYYYAYLSHTKGVENLNIDTNYINIDEALADNITLNSGDNGKMVVVQSSSIDNLAIKANNLPILLLKVTSIKSYDEVGDGKPENFLRWYEKYYQEGENDISEFDTTVYYSPGGQNLVNYSDKGGYKFKIAIQGTSTKANFSKNFELSVESTDEDDKYTFLFTPNFQKEDPNKVYTEEQLKEIHNTFLPEQSFTLKADVVDSSHSNNNAIGAFVNDNTTKFNISSTDTTYSKYIKNCLIGFPCLLFVEDHNLETGTTITYYLGIYNFNLGRESASNLGYVDSTNFQKDKITHVEQDGLTTSPGLQNGFGIYKILTKDYQYSKGLFVAEVQEGDKYFDFSQYDDTIVNGTNNVNGMFGDLKYGSDLNEIQTALPKFVQRVAMAGGFIFDNLKKNFGPNDDGYNASVYKYDKSDENNKYLSINQVPDYRIQYARKYENDQVITYCKNKTDSDGNIIKKDSASETDFWNCVLDNQDTNTPAFLNYESAVEYYTICMAFSMLDSVEKNLNIKSWNKGKQWYVAFYDMDTALGKDNAGNPVLYYAFSDYWKSNASSSILLPATIYRDFQPQILDEIFFDVPSTYLFAIAKYAKVIDGDTEGRLGRVFPLTLWAKWRNTKGPLVNADAFVNKYFTGRFKNFSPELLNLDYRAKYLIHTKDSTNTNLYAMYDTKAINQFKGSGQYYVRDWLNNRLHILDVYMGLCHPSTSTSRTIQTYNLTTKKWEDVKRGDNPVTEPDLTGAHAEFPSDNSDINIYKDIFMQGNTSLKINNNISIAIKTLPRTFTVITQGTKNPYRYYTNPTDPNTLYTINLDLTGNQGVMFGGSDRWTYISDLTPIIHGQNRIYLNSKNLTNFYFDNSALSDEIKNQVYLPKCTEIKFTNSRKLTAQFYISPSNFPILATADFSNTSAEININNIKTLTEIKARGMTSEKKIFSVTNCNNLSTLDLSSSQFYSVTIDPMIASPNLSGMKCELLTLVATDGKQQSVVIQNNPKLKTVTLRNFKSITIDNCLNLTTVIIDDGNGNLETLKITNCHHGNNVTENLTVHTSKSTTTIVDLSPYTNLHNVSFYNTTGFTEIKFPDNDNINLSTAAFESTNLTTISGGKAYITGPRTFRYTPITRGLSHLYITNNCKDLSETFKCHEDARDTLVNYLTKEEAWKFIDNIPNDNNITNISLLFYCQSGIIYTKETGFDEYKKNKCYINLDKFTKVTDISYAFGFTNIEFLNKYMFKEVGTKSTNPKGISMSNIFGSKVSKFYTTIDGLENILPKTTAIDLTATWWYWGRPIVIVNTDGSINTTPNVAEFFNSDTYDTTNIRTISQVNFYTYIKKSETDDTQEIKPQYEGLFSAKKWPNLHTITGYAFNNIIMDDFSQIGLSNITYLSNVSGSFQNITSTKNPIDYGNIIKWNKDNVQAEYFMDGTLKYINKKDYDKIFSIIYNNNVRSLQHLFMNTVLINPEENCYITITNDVTKTIINNPVLPITSLSATFQGFHLLSELTDNIKAKFTSSTINRIRKPLTIDRKFISLFGYCTSFDSAFVSTYIKDVPGFDFFSRRIRKVKEVYKEKEDTKINLVTYNYTQDINDISQMFMYCKFQNNIFETNSYSTKTDSNGVSYITDNNNTINIYDNHLEDANGNYIPDTKYRESNIDTTVFTLQSDPYLHDIQNPTECNYDNGPDTINTVLTDAIGNHQGWYILSPDFFASLSQGDSRQVTAEDCLSNSNLLGSLPPSLIINIDTQNKTHLFYNVNVLPTKVGTYTFKLENNKVIREKTVYTFIPAKFCHFSTSSEGMFAFARRLPSNSITTTGNITSVNSYYMFLDTSFAKTPSSLSNAVYFVWSYQWSWINNGSYPLNMMFNTNAVGEDKICTAETDGWNLYRLNKDGFNCDNLYNADFTQACIGNLFYGNPYVKDIQRNSAPAIHLDKQVSQGIIFPRAVDPLQVKHAISCADGDSYTVNGIPDNTSLDNYTRAYVQTNVKFSTSSNFVK